MVPTKAGKYEFSTQSVREIRERLGLSQAKMAQLLGVPANTLSRWETGATTPNAETLATIYSTALKNGITPTFFRRRRPVSKPSQHRSRLLAMWDFQNLGVSTSEVDQANSWIMGQIEKRFSGTSYRSFKAFSHLRQSAATDELEKLGWKVWEDDIDMDDEIISHSKSDCGQEPRDTVIVLITRDGDFAELVQDLKRQGVHVWLIAPVSGSNGELVGAIGNKRWIKIE